MVSWEKIEDIKLAYQSYITLNIKVVKQVWYVYT